MYTIDIFENKVFDACGERKVWQEGRMGCSERVRAAVSPGQSPSPARELLGCWYSEVDDVCWLNQPFQLLA